MIRILIKHEKAISISSKPCEDKTRTTEKFNGIKLPNQLLINSTIHNQSVFALLYIFEAFIRETQIIFFIQYFLRFTAVAVFE